MTAPKRPGDKVDKAHIVSRQKGIEMEAVAPEEHRDRGQRVRGALGGETGRKAASEPERHRV